MALVPSGDDRNRKRQQQPAKDAHQRSDKRFQESLKKRGR
jgi:hypothetical protein